MAAEPRPMFDFTIARALALAAAGRGHKDDTDIERLLTKARRLGWRPMIPALEAAL
jgi:hypothetical protein